MTRRPLLAALALLLGACDGGTGGEEFGAGSDAPVWRGTVLDSAGIVVVANPPDGLWSESSGWKVREEMRIGSLSGDPAYQFGRVGSIAVGSAGQFVVVDRQAPSVRVFDADGTHVRTVGRKGGGPGEFAGPAHAEFGPHGHLWVPDPQNARLSVIDTTGAFVTEHRMPGGFFMTPWPGGFDLAGGFYLPVPLNRDGEFGLAIVRHDLELNPLDTLPRIENPNPPRRWELVNPDGDGRLVASVPFWPGLTRTRAPQGTQWGLMTGDYTLFEVGVTGDTLRVIQADFEPFPVTDTDREEALEGLSWFTDEGGRVDTSLIPDTKPAAWSLFVDETGRIWVNRMTDRPRGQDFDVFDSTGQLLGGVELPVPIHRMQRVVGDYIYGVTQDELGVPYIVRLRIDR